MESKPMKIIKNIALFTLTRYCLENNINCEDTHIVKQQPKKYIYCLCNNKGRTIAAISFGEYQAPTITPGR